MAFFGKLRALLMKNWLLWRRKLGGSLCELLFPIFIVFILLLLRLALPPEDESAKPEVDEYQIVAPFTSDYTSNTTGFTDYIVSTGRSKDIPFAWCDMVAGFGWKYAIVPEYYPGGCEESRLKSLATIEGYVNQGISEFMEAGLKIGNYTKWREQLPLYQCFDTNKKLEDHITSSKYDDQQKDKTCFAVVINEFNNTFRNWKLVYELRYNYTSTNPDNQSLLGNTQDVFLTEYLKEVNDYQRGVVLTYQNEFVSSGFLQAMNLVINYLISMANEKAYFSSFFIPFPQLKHTSDVFSLSFAGLLGFLIFITSMVPIARLINNITTEKYTKVREAMKMMGLTDTPYWLSWIIMYGLIYLVIAICCTVISIPVFEHQDKFVVFLLFYLYGLSCLSYSLLISAIMTKPKTAILVGMLVFFVSYFPLFSFTQSTSESTKVGVSFFNCAAMSQGFETLLLFEGNQVHIGFSNLNLKMQNYSMAISLTMLFFDSLIYLLLALYLDKVIPGEYGVSLPWYFPFTKNFWMGRQESEYSEDSLDDEDRERLRRLHENDKIEPIDGSLQHQIDTGQAMVVRGLKKRFGNKEAVSNLDLEMFEGQIFALLGHNGAGKTTTISMLTGMLRPTAGKMHVRGLDFSTGMPEIRKHLGICPQHDILFKELTVQEHLEMFCRFKGLTKRAEIQKEIDDQIQAIDLLEKRNVYSKNLSGGQKRKLSLAIALIGGSSIVMLDEPTSGMDLTARRRMWDMLRNDKRGRIIILTTHYMEEADILADRIAIMHQGKLSCLGSPLFLKKRFGVGYNLTIVRKVGTGKEFTLGIKDLVMQILDDTQVFSEASAEITFRIPMDQSPRFSRLFSELDSNLERLGIETYGISVTTLEEVFLRVARGDDEDLPDASRRSMSLTTREKLIGIETETPYEMDSFGEDSRARDFNIAEHRKSGIFYTFFYHFWALLEKRAIYSMRDCKGLCMEIILPLILVLFGLVFITQLVQVKDMKSLNLNLKPYHNPQLALYNEGNNEVEVVMKTVQSQQKDYTMVTPVNDYYNYTIQNDVDFSYALLNYSAQVNSKQMGAYYFETENPAGKQNVSVFHNTTAFQSCPTFLNTIGQAAVQESWGSSEKMFADTLDMTVYNHPLPLTQRQRSFYKNANTITATMIFAIGMAFIPTGIVTFIVREREENIKHQLLVSGVSLPAYWLSNYTWDLLKYLLPGVLCPLFIKAFELRSLSDSSETYSATWIFFGLYGIAIPFYTYCMSFLFKKYSTAQFTVFMFNLTMGFVATLVVWILRLINSNTRDVADVMQWPFRVVSPIFCFSFGLSNVANVDTFKILYGYKTTPSVYDWKIAGADMFFLGLSAILSAIGLFLIEYLGTLKSVQNLGAARDPGPNTYNPDDDVEDLKTKAAAADSSQVAVKVAGLRKVYGGIGGQVKVAIQELSFLVPYQECFALLGVNGAGKTSTFRILTGEYAPTEGDAFINGFSVVNDIARARYNIGYCPQFDALSDLLTPREHLKLYARIKGIPGDLIPYFVEKQLSDMGLKKYEKYKSGTLSGGNKRKLSVAIACIGNPPVVFLDEPSAGMDPGARKNMWAVINNIKRQKCSIILTTHSMDEAEALSNTIGIMVAGRLRCFGTVTHIKNKFSSGYELDLKVVYPSDEAISKGLDLINQYVVDGFVHESSIEPVLNAFGAFECAVDISAEGSGSHLYQELRENRRIEARNLIGWILIELIGKKIEAWLFNNFLSTAFVEHYGSYFLFKIEARPDQSIGTIFGMIEENKDELEIGEYSLSQTTLEQIFNMFATETQPGRQSGNQGNSRISPIN